MREEWRDIVGYEGFYQVSNMGSVRSLTRTFMRSDGSRVTYRGKILNPSCPCPYLTVVLSKKNKHYTTRVHRLVAEAFIPNPDGLRCIDHIDCDKTNNRVDNLRWCTHAENTRYAKENGSLPTIKLSERSPEQQAKYRAASKARRIPIIRSDGKVYECREDAARDLGVTYSAISHVLMGLCKTSGGYGFDYYKSDD